MNFEIACAIPFLASRVMIWLIKHRKKTGAMSANNIACFFYFNSLILYVCNFLRKKNIWLPIGTCKHHHWIIWFHNLWLETHEITYNQYYLIYYNRPCSIAFRSSVTSPCVTIRVVHSRLSHRKNQIANETSNLMTYFFFTLSNPSH